MKYIIIALLLYLTFTMNLYLGCVVTLAGILYFIYMNFPAVYARQGNAAFNDKKYEKALSLYEKAYKTGRASGTITLTYAILLLRLGKAEEAETIFNLLILSRDKKIKDDIKNRAKQYRALLYYKTKRINDAMEEALEVFEKYKSTVSYGLLCYLKLALNEPVEEVFPLCEEAYEYNSDDRDIADNMAVAYIKKGEYEKAKEVIDKLLKNHPQFTEAYYHGAIVYKALGNTEKAKEILENIDNCTRTYLTTVSIEEIEELKNQLNQ